MENSIWSALRDGSWRRVSGGLLPGIATIAVATDLLTTGYGFYSPAYVEVHPILVWFAGIDPALSLAALAGYCLVNLAIAWLSFGWFSPVVAAVLTVMVGLGGFNNLVLFVTGTGLYSRLGVSQQVVIHVFEPVAGVVLGLAIARLRGPLPWREVVLVLSPGLSVLSLPLWL